MDPILDVGGIVRCEGLAWVQGCSGIFLGRSDKCSSHNNVSMYRMCVEAACHP